MANNQKKFLIIFIAFVKIIGEKILYDILNLKYTK